MDRRLLLKAAACSLYASLAPPVFGAPKTELKDIPIGSLAYRVNAAPEKFTVIDSRMDETATAAVLFGIVGATLNSAANNSEDQAKAAPLAATAASLDLAKLIGQSLRERLASRGTIVLADAPESASHILVLAIGEWGLVRRAQKPDPLMRTFLKLNMSIEDRKARTVWGPQREHTIGQLNAELGAFTPEIFKAEMENLATNVGQQIANKINYR